MTKYLEYVIITVQKDKDIKGNKMLKQEFINHLEDVVQGYEGIYANDKPAIRQLFNDTKDGFHRDGMITDSQVQNWILTDRELNRLLKLSKGN